MPPAPLNERIAHFVARPDPDAFGELALAAFRELCERNDRPVEIDDWRAIPAEPPPETAVDSDAALALQRDAAERAFRSGCLDGLEASPPILDLAPGSALAAGSRERLGGPGSAAGVRGERIDVVAARSWLAARQRDRRPALLLADGPACLRLLGALERQDLRFQLAFGSRLVLVEPLPDLDLRRTASVCAERLALGPEGLRGSRSWPGVPTPLYGRLNAAGRIVDAIASPWLRFRCPPAGGALSVFDLTIRDRAFHLETGASGSVDGQSVSLA